MAVDPFSDFLKLTNAQSLVSGALSAGGTWAVRFPAFQKMKFFAVIKGDCWLSIAGREHPVRIKSGDVFLLSAQSAFVIAGDLEASPVDAEILFSDPNDRIVTLGEGDESILMGGQVRLDPANGALLTDVLPPLIHVAASSPRASILQWLLDQLLREQGADQPGTSIASAQLAQLMFVQILRAHLETATPLAAGWLRAVADKRIAPALRLMHSNPGRSWQLEELAKAAAMSRTTFAVHFRTVAGVPPLTYLHDWRMRLAERALREEDTSMSIIAQSLGYSSDSAFSNAFKRTIGMAPKLYRKAGRADEALRLTGNFTGTKNLSSSAILVQSADIDEIV